MVINNKMLWSGQQNEVTLNCVVIAFIFSLAFSLQIYLLKIQRLPTLNKYLQISLELL